MDHIPWREIKSWRCISCGNCCTLGLKINLRSYEYLKILNFWPKSIELDRFGGPILKKIGSRCVFYNRFCNLQPFNLKPLACKVWPFAVYLKPQSSERERARFIFEDHEYFIYLNPYAKSVCFGIGRGNPDDLPHIVNEILKIYKNPLRKQTYTTSKS